MRALSVPRRLDELEVFEVVDLDAGTVVLGRQDDLNRIWSRSLWSVMLLLIGWTMRRRSRAESSCPRGR